ncbi:hypothetical protein [Nonomuraea sp. NPDC003214]
MNAETADLLFDVVARLEKSIVARECPAIIALQGERQLLLSDYDYLRDTAAAAAFETRAAEKAQEVGAGRWVLAVPQVWIFKPPSTIALRAVSNHPLREGEQEAITWMSFDREQGSTTAGSPTRAAPAGSRSSRSRRSSMSGSVRERRCPATSCSSAAWNTSEGPVHEEPTL